jgi:Immunity protein 15
VSEEDAAMVDIDPRFRSQIQDLIDKHDLSKFDRLMGYHGYFDELPLFTRYAEVSFLHELPVAERNRILIRAAVAHLGVILDYSRTFYEGRDHDYFCAVTVTGWEYVAEGDVVIPRFWYANPSHGVFDYVKLDPPDSEYSRFVADCLEHSPDYVINDDVVREYSETRIERVWIQHVSCLRPTKD